MMALETLAPLASEMKEHQGCKTQLQENYSRQSAAIFWQWNSLAAAVPLSVQDYFPKVSTIFPICEPSGACR
jgi:hypothetical protein